jgi:hypothetical protein
MLADFLWEKNTVTIEKISRIRRIISQMNRASSIYSTLVGCQGGGQIGSRGLRCVKSVASATWENSRCAGKDDNGYPWPETRRVFTLLGHGYGSISLPMSLLMGKKLNPVGLWAWVWACSTQTRKPMGFLNPFHHRIVAQIILQMS